MLSLTDQKDGQSISVVPLPVIHLKGAILCVKSWRSDADPGGWRLQSWCALQSLQSLHSMQEGADKGRERQGRHTT